MYSPANQRGTKRQKRSLPSKSAGEYGSLRAASACVWAQLMCHALPCARVTHKTSFSSCAINKKMLSYASSILFVDTPASLPMGNLEPYSVWHRGDMRLCVSQSIAVMIIAPGWQLFGWSPPFPCVSQLHFATI